MKISGISIAFTSKNDFIMLNISRIIATFSVSTLSVIKSSY